MTSSHVDRLISSQAKNIHIIRAKDHTGRRAYYVVLVPPAREPAFLHALKQPGASVDVADWGKVLASNYGEGPTEGTRVLLKERYNFSV